MMTDARTTEGAPSRPLSTQLLIGALGVALGVAVSELAARVMLPDRNWTPEVAISTSAMQATPFGYHRTKPNLAFTAQSRWYPGTPIFTDEKGHRTTAPDVPRTPRGPEVEDVLMLGASYTWGVGTAARDCFPFRLERYVTEAGRPIRLTNAAQAGYALPQMLAAMEEIPDGELPDRVLLVTPKTSFYMFGFGAAAGDYVFENMHGNGLILLPLMYDPYEFPELEQVDGWLMRKDRDMRGPVLDFLRTRTALGHRCLMRYINYVRPTRVVRSEKEFDYEALHATARRIGARMKRVVRRYREHGVPVHDVIIPADWRDMHDEVTPERVKLATTFFAAAGIGEGLFDRIDLSDPKSPFYVPTTYGIGHDFMSHDRHYSLQGHEKVARALARWYLTLPPAEKTRDH